MVGASSPDFGPGEGESLPLHAVAAPIAARQEKQKTIHVLMQALMCSFVHLGVAQVLIASSSAGVMEYPELGGGI